MAKKLDGEKTGLEPTGQTSSGTAGQGGFKISGEKGGQLRYF
jgi:hypothetical protein